jgi:uncharacterized Zn finger protein
MTYTIPNSKLFYSAAAIGRILETGARNITEIKVIGDSVQFKYLNEPRQLPKQSLLNEFVRFRQVNGDRLRETGMVTRDSQTQFSCKSQKKIKGETETETYLLEVTAQGVSCTCPDMHDQFTEIGRGVCKHGYAVLGILGFRTLAEFHAELDRKEVELREEARRNEATRKQLDRAPTTGRQRPTLRHGVSID